MGFLKFLFSRQAVKPLVRMGLLYLGVALVVWVFLRWYTDHGEYIAVPELKGLALTEAVRQLEEAGLTALVVDSVYDEDAPPGSVMEQSPQATSQVKDGRQVFLTVYRIQPPMERISIEEGEYAQVAIIKLKNKGIRFDVRYVPNNNMVGSVISITHGGRKLKKGDEIRRGERVVITVGESTDQAVQIPDLSGRTYAEAIALLDSLNLVGQGYFEPDAMSTQDSALFRVCRQDPEYAPDALPVAPGRMLDFWLSKEPCNPPSE